MPSVANLFRARKRRLPMEELHAAEAITDLGFTGCCHGRRGSNRQLLVPAFGVTSMADVECCVGSSKVESFGAAMRSNAC